MFVCGRHLFLHNCPQSRPKSRRWNLAIIPPPRVMPTDGPHTRMKHDLANADTDKRSDQLGKLLTALDVIAKLIETRTGRREEDRIARARLLPAPGECFVERCAA